MEVSSSETVIKQNRETPLNIVDFEHVNAFPKEPNDCKT